MAGFLKRRERCTGKTVPCEDIDMGWGCLVSGETGVMHPQAKGCQGVPANTRSQKRQKRILTCGVQRESSLADTWISDFRPPEL